VIHGLELTVAGMSRSGDPELSHYEAILAELKEKCYVDHC
jgi:hypothetical protein